MVVVVRENHVGRIVQWADAEFRRDAMYAKGRTDKSSTFTSRNVKARPETRASTQRQRSDQLI